MRISKTQQDFVVNLTGKLALPAKEIRTEKATLSNASKSIDSASCGNLQEGVSAHRALLPYWSIDLKIILKTLRVTESGKVA